MNQRELIEYFKENVNKALASLKSRVKVPSVLFEEVKDGEDILLKWNVRRTRTIKVLPDGTFLDYDVKINNIDDFIESTVKMVKFSFKTLCQSKLGITWGEAGDEDTYTMAVYSNIDARYEHYLSELDSVARAYEQIDAKVRSLREKDMLASFIRHESLKYSDILGFAVGGYDGFAFDDDIVAKVHSDDEKVFNEGLRDLVSESKKRFQNVSSFVQAVKENRFNADGTLEDVLNQSKAYVKKNKQLALTYNHPYLDIYLANLDMDDYIKNKFKNLERFLNNEITWDDLIN